MKSHFFCTALLSVSVLSARAHAAGVDVFSCKRQNAGTWSDCLIQPIELALAQAYELTFTGRYDWRCAPRQSGMRSVGVQSNSETRFFEFGTSGSFELTGSSGLRVIDTDPVGTSLRVFAPGCALEVELLSSVPSAGQRQIWSAKRSELAESLRKATVARDGFAELIRLKPAFDFLKQLNDALLGDLAKNLELRKLIVKEGSIYAILKQLVFSTVHLNETDPVSGQILSSKELSQQQKEAILDILGKIDSLPALEFCATDSSPETCRPYVMNDFLTDEQRRILSELSSLTSFFDKANDHYRMFASDVVTREAELIALCRVSKNWIPWNAENTPAQCDTL